MEGYDGGGGGAKGRGDAHAPTTAGGPRYFGGGGCAPDVDSYASLLPTPRGAAAHEEDGGDCGDATVGGMLTARYERAPPPPLPPPPSYRAGAVSGAADAGRAAAEARGGAPQAAQVPPHPPHGAHAPWLVASCEPLCSEVVVCSGMVVCTPLPHFSSVPGMAAQQPAPPPLPRGRPPAPAAAADAPARKVARPKAPRKAGGAAGAAAAAASAAASAAGASDAPAGGIAALSAAAAVAADEPKQRTSRCKGVTSCVGGPLFVSFEISCFFQNPSFSPEHRWTGRYEAHLWDAACERPAGSTKGRARGAFPLLLGLEQRSYDETLCHVTTDACLIGLRLFSGRQIYLGGYETEELAARAFDTAALKARPQLPQTSRVFSFLLTLPISDQCCP